MSTYPFVHKCSLDWLKERQEHLTASDVRRLVPVTKTGRPRTITDADRIKIWASKIIDLTEKDCYSYGAAARGHLLEPYAIMEFNRNLEVHRIKETFHWWDDKLVVRSHSSLAFSPDGADVPIESDQEISAIVEIKCYSPEKHMLTAYTPKMEIEERWQIATAMAVLPSIDHAYLVLYNPDLMFNQLFYIRYERDELEGEICQVLKVEKDWIEWGSRLPPGVKLGATFLKREDILKMEDIPPICNDNNLNP